MGNRIGKVCLCSAGAGNISRRHENNNTNPLRNSICYVRPPDPFSDDDVTTFRSLTGASVSANSSTPPSTVVLDSYASFESSTSSSSSMPLHHHHHHDAWRAGSSAGSCSAVWWSPTTTERGLFSSCPVPNEKGSSLEKKLRRSFSHKPRKQILREILKRAISGSIVVKGVVKKKKKENATANVRVSGGDDAELSLHEAEEDDDDNYLDDEGCGGDLFLLGSEKNLQWAQGRAGEDRVHIVISEEHGWVFVGIYDGFNGPDATDYLLHNLFYAVHDELKWLLCGNNNNNQVLGCLVKGNDDGLMVHGYCSSILDEESHPAGNYEKLDLDPVVKRMNSRSSSSDDVLLGLSEALRKTEDAFLRSVDEVICNNPVLGLLAMMGSCVLVMLMKGEDVYLMNVGDSRAVLATHSAKSIQLTMEHSTLVKQEVHRIRKEHPDDPCAITKGRVKGYLNVTRAFGAGFLKQPKQNNAVLEAFKVNYIGDSPYITCSPSLHHQRLSPSDRFLILSSDGLHQYFTNEEAVAKVESLINLSPDIDPAQLLIKEALCRAAKKAGMDFHELLKIPQGERRLYHDDISIVIVSFEGKIWRSSV